MPIDESIFTEDIEALDEGFEAIDEAFDEAIDEDFGEAIRGSYGRSQSGNRGGPFGGRGAAPSSGSATRNSFNNAVRGPQQNLYGRVQTPAGTARVEIPSSVASKKDLKGITEGVSKDLKQNQAAINSINQNLARADKNLSRSRTSLEKKVTALQLTSLAALVIAPQLTSLTTKEGGTLTVTKTKYNYLLPLIVAIAVPLMVNSSKGTGAAANIWPLVLILGLVVLNNYTSVFSQKNDDDTSDKTGNFLADNGPLLIVGVVILLTMTDSKVFG